jgi:glycosyltransferase involved in cell wall biosynthesis
MDAFFALPNANMSDYFTSISIAVIIPCFNEQETIARVVRDFRAVLPGATVYVCDNNSSDQTVEKALEAGAVTCNEPLQGKGNVVRRMFGDVEADVYLVVDGDNTYDPGSAPAMIRQLLDNGLDMVSGARYTEIADAYRPGHRFGNLILTRAVGMIFGNQVKDMLSGYRAFSRRYVKSFPAISTGFEIETELTVHALELRMPIDELPTQYRARPEGSASKLRTFRDGFRILKTIAILVKEERPFQFFSILFVALALLSLMLGAPIVVDYMETGLVPRFPTAILATALMLLAFLCLSCGLVLDTVTHGRREMKRMWYLSIPRLTADQLGRKLLIH